MPVESRLYIHLFDPAATSLRQRKLPNIKSRVQADFINERPPVTLEAGQPPNEANAADAFILPASLYTTLLASLRAKFPKVAHDSNNEK